ncbi:MAG TPA: NADH-quinone oxidoreductase subunit N [Acidimicrobiales bacterium]|nr:NADH-quinone oxidoreductase subunit N [Acidimicrobiales bacterium]
MSVASQLGGAAGSAAHAALLASTGALHAHRAATITTPQIRYEAILPEIVMLGGAVLLLAVGSLVQRQLRVRVATLGTLAVSAGALGASLWQWADATSSGPFSAIDHAVVVDGFSALVNVLVSCAMFLTALVADGYLRRERVEGAELHVLSMVSASGAMIMGSANDLIVVFLGLEILSIALYVLAAFNHRRAASGEAALKYFVLGSFSSAVFVYGIALVYGATGTSNLAQIAGFLSKNVLASDGLLLAGMSLLIVGFAFKVAAVPFHMWTPDVYQGAPSPVTGFMAAVSKAGAFAAFLRVFLSSFGLLRTDWQPVIYGIAVVTLLLGAGLAVVQRDVKRMLAYSSINHAGFVLLGLEAATARGVGASLYYLFAYTFMVIGSFAVVTVLGRSGDAAHDIASYRGLARRQPLLALAFAVLLLAQAGAPFTTGLWAKLQVVLAAVDHQVPLAVIAMVSAAVAAFFYLRVAVLMYTPLPVEGAVPGVEPDAEDPVRLGRAVRATGATQPEIDRQMAETQPEPVGDIRAPRRVVARPVWTGTERNVAALDRLNAALLLDEDPMMLALVGAEAGVPPAPAAPAEAGAADGAADGGRVVGPGSEGARGERLLMGPSAPVASLGLDTLAGGSGETLDAVSVLSSDPVHVPALGAVAIALCVGVTVVLGFWPGPLTSFAHHATLLFLP